MNLARRGFASSVLVSAALLASTLAGASNSLAAGVTRPQRLSKDKLDFFEQKIRPVLTHKCYSCHSGDPAKAKAHLVLDTRAGVLKGGESGAVVVPGRPGDSPLIEAIRYENLEMPPTGKLPDEVINDFVQWIEMGAPDPRVGKAARPRGKIDMAEGRKFWAFRHPKASTPPAVQNASWPYSDIDRFVLARLEKEHLQPVGDADPVTLIRRVTFDLTGLPPTHDEIDAFVADRSSAALPSLVNRLLASPQFGERWGRHWLDVVRYGESTGKERNIPYRYAWRYRDYVIDAFNSGKPFNRFIVEQLAGDLLPAKEPSDKDRLLVATGLLAVGPKSVALAKPEKFRMEQIDDQIDVTTRAFLGITVACARCHDHKFDPIPTTDYYAMAGIFHSTRTYSGIGPGIKHASDDRLLRLTDEKANAPISDEAVKRFEERQGQIESLKRQLAALEKRRAQANKQMPQGARKGKAAQRRRPQTGSPPIDLAKLRKQIKEIEDKIDALASEPSPYTNFVMAVSESDTPSDCNVLGRGELENKGPVVPRGVLTVMKTAQASHIPPRQSGRLQLARWIASPDNPLTARVIVNRVWEHLLGQGIVGTVDNFGALGDEPSHPELLDTLAVKFMEEKWSIKQLIRLIVLSHVYQLASDHDATNYEKDPDNRLLWRMNRRRLDAEAIRDAMLAASGELELARPAGSAVMELSNRQIFRAKSMDDAEYASVRSVYLPTLRNVMPEVLQVFDAADPNLIIGKRDVTIVPTQALLLMNSPFVLQRAESMAKRVLAQEGVESGGRVELAYRLALGRLPSETEKSHVLSYLRDYRQSLETAGHRGAPNLAAWTSVCQTLFATGQFRYVY